jgi:glutamate formiminotransferase
MDVVIAVPRSVSLCGEAIPLAGKDTLTTKRRHGATKATNPCKQIDELERESRHNSTIPILVKEEISAGTEVTHQTLQLGSQKLDACVPRGDHPVKGIDDVIRHITNQHISSHSAKLAPLGHR